MVAVVGSSITLLPSPGCLTLRMRVLCSMPCLPACLLPLVCRMMSCAGGLDFSAPVKKFFYDPLGSGKAFVDTVVSLTGFALVGGPARQDAPKAVEALTKLNVPYLVSLPLVFQTTEEWLDSELGVHPVQVALQVSVREGGGGEGGCWVPGV